MARTVIAQAKKGKKMNDKLSIGEVEEIAIKAAIAKNVPAWKDLAVNIESLAKQLADTMRQSKETDDALQSSADWSAQLKGDNDRLQKAINDLVIAHNILHESFCDTSAWKDDLQKQAKYALASYKHSVKDNGDV